MHLDLVPGLCLLVALGGGPLATPAEPLPAVTALVTRVDGSGSAEAPGGRLVELRPGQVLPGDSRISVPAGGAVALVCSGERHVLLEAGGESRAVRRPLEIAAEAACAGGELLLPGTYRALARGDRDLALERSGQVRHRVLQVNTRGAEEDDPRIPVLLAPRETAVRHPRPDIRWTRVAGAVEYVLELVGTTPWSERIRVQEVACTTVEHPPGRLEICAVAWPASAPDLRSGETVFLTVGARTGTVSPLRAAEERSLRLVSPELGARVEAAVAAIREAGLPPGETALRSGTLLAAHGLRGEATDLLRASLAEEPSGPGFLLLGALELERQLPRAAIRSFEEALRQAAEDTGLVEEAREGIALARRLLGEER